jgi:hypothetical protein
VAKEEFWHKLDAGIVRCSKSPWSSPLHLVRKKDGTWWPCGNFRCLNLITTADWYLLPNMADCSACLDGFSIYSKLVQQKGYPCHRSRRPQMAVITPFGLFEFI